ncbi:uncharacterized protein LOC130895997 [Diorhabda carinulata]|uniref:uncharacterized protein LOC130451126 n=1 Tax=Diorhabda sublineata TaxID=1163346 RepID=UPI0024E0B9C0|nr:uncharacterized protein LOC130451126 [Diorhabda sublineata]XP_057659692.1 uncharacterized protein LOC130895997 [Diorhabda carinulata]
MPSAEMCNMTSNASSKFSISSKEIEGLVLEIKENLRLSAASATIQYKAIPRSRSISKRSSRASPYSRPPKCCDKRCCDTNCVGKHKTQEVGSEDPYELLQKFLRDGSLVSEAVKRIQLGLTTKQFYYDSDDECRTPVFRFIHQDN